MKFRTPFLVAVFTFSTLVLGASDKTREVSFLIGSGGDAAVLSVRGMPASAPLPQAFFGPSKITFRLERARLPKATRGRFVLEAPHPLVSAVQAVTDGDGVNVALTLRAEAGRAREALSMKHSPAGIEVRITPPAALKVAEEKPVEKAVEKPAEKAGEKTLTKADVAETKPETATMDGVLVGCLLLLGVCLGGIVGLLVGRNRGAKKARDAKVPVQQLQFYPLEGKAGVSIVRVGNEFLIVGVTPYQVTFLKALNEASDEAVPPMRHPRSPSAHA